MPPDEEKPVEWVGEDIIRQKFNDGQYAQKVRDGVLIATRKRNGHPERPPQPDPYCTRSQIFFYYDLQGELVAVVHQYLRPDGSLGGKGRPDPKRLILPDKIIAVKSKPK
jgi:hypothetical protein